MGVTVPFFDEVALLDHERKAFEAGYSWGYGNGHHDGEADEWNADSGECYEMWVHEDGRTRPNDAWRERRPDPVVLCGAADCESLAWWTDPAGVGWCYRHRGCGLYAAPRRRA